MDAERQLQQALWAARQGAAKSMVGTVIGVDFATSTVTVDTAGVVQQLPWAGTAPFDGARVRVHRLGQQSFCTLAAEGATYGTVDSVAGSVATVFGTDGKTYRYPYPFDASLSAGHVVALDHSRRLVLFRVSSTPGGPVDGEDPPVVPVKATPPSSKRVTRVFKPVASWNWYADGGRWDSQAVEISVSRSGYYFYGTQIDNTIPDSATILSARVYLSEVWDRVPGVPSLMGVHGYSARPGSGPLGLSGAVPVSGGGSHSLTLAQANALKDGAAYGIGFAQNTGWRRFDSYVRSGAITITWET